MFSLGEDCCEQDELKGNDCAGREKGQGEFSNLLVVSRMSRSDAKL